MKIMLNHKNDTYTKFLTSPFTPKSFENIEEYCEGWGINKIFPINSVGVETQRDKVTIHQKISSLIRLLQDLKSHDIDSFRNLYDVKPDGRDWTLARAKTSVCDIDLNDFQADEILYRPFDIRFTYLNPETKGFIAYPRYKVMQHLFGHGKGNLALIGSRMIKGEEPRHVFVADKPVEKICISPKTSNNAFVFPLYLYPGSDDNYQRLIATRAIQKIQRESGKFSGKDIELEESRVAETIKTLFPNSNYLRWVNIHPDFLADVENRLNIKFVPDGEGYEYISETFGPENIFHYIYALLHSSIYRSRYTEFLRIDFPRIPLTSNPKLFRALCDFGMNLVKLHLLEGDISNLPTYPVDGDHLVSNVRYIGPSSDDDKGTIWINDTQYFRGISPEVWEFRVGGYQVCRKWLKERKGTNLSYNDREHLPKDSSSHIRNYLYYGEDRFSHFRTRRIPFAIETYLSKDLSYEKTTRRPKNPKTIIIISNEI